MNKEEIKNSHLSNRAALRRNHLLGICEALSTYIERDLPLTLTTVDGADAVDESLIGATNPAVVFTITDWEAFREILEPGSTHVGRIGTDDSTGEVQL